MGTAGDKEFAKKHYDDLVAEKKLLQASRDRLLEGGQGPRRAHTPTPSVAGRFQHVRIILHAAQ